MTTKTRVQTYRFPPSSLRSGDVILVDGAAREVVYVRRGRRERGNTFDITYKTPLGRNDVLSVHADDRATVLRVVTP